MDFKQISLYFHTLRFLRLKQILGRAWFRLRNVKPDFRSPPPLRSKGADLWIAHLRKPPLMLSPTLFRILNEEREITSRRDWFAHPEKKLWLYNLHYFEDLNARDADERGRWHEELIRRWIEENPPGSGFGWDPYPLSLRIVNWIKWSLRGNPLSEEAIKSLAVQIRYLRKRYDYHLLGNHLLVNAKTFIFSGLFFEGSEADEWFAKGTEILHRQIPEQVPDDGGHFERSPMYHNLILEDFLDLYNLYRVYGREDEFEWRDVIERMLRWAFAMAHPDGDIALFNDAAFGISLSAEELAEYARRLGFPVPEFTLEGAVHLKQSGFVRLDHKKIVLIADVGSVAPPYLPGHAHAGTLSFELSLDGERLIVDSGTGTYDITPERLRQRGTAAHNTVVVDGQDSSEVWSSFRVARRANVLDVRVAEENSGLVVIAAHDGYRRLPGVQLHRRHWFSTERELVITDEITGKGHHSINVSFHFHPEISLFVGDDGNVVIEKRGKTVGVIKTDEKLAVSIVPSTYHPEFGLSLANRKLTASGSFTLPIRLITCFTWSE
jgi:uncharacterized heparinase superfamily protein